MGMNSKIKENFVVAEDGTIKRPSDLEASILNIIRVAASKDNLLAAYDAQKRCYKLCKKAGRLDFRDYVETLQLDNYPLELKKAEYGRRYVRLLWWLSGTAILNIGGLISGIATISYAVRWERDNGTRYFNGFYWDEFFVGLVLIIASILLFFVLKFLVNKIKTAHHLIRNVK